MSVTREKAVSNYSQLHLSDNCRVVRLSAKRSNRLALIDPATLSEATVPFSHFKISSSNEEGAEGAIIEVPLQFEDDLIGLGQLPGELQRRGRLTKTTTRMQSPQYSNALSTNGAHPLLYQKTETGVFGYYVDCPQGVIFDLANSDLSAVKIEIPTNNADIYFFAAASMQAVYEEFIGIVGPGYIPPRWAFGFQQCKYSYKTQDEVKSVADHFVNHDIPCDAIHLDIHYMDRFKIFTLDQEAFPDFDEMTEYVQERGMKLVPIVDPGVAEEPGYPIYDEGLKGDHFTCHSDGSPYVPTVWPGNVRFVNYFKKASRDWWGSLYSFFTSKGVKGFWNDMNEPETFLSRAAMKVLAEEAMKVHHDEKATGIEIDDLSLMPKEVLWDSAEERADVQYENDEGEVFLHQQVENLFGHKMAEATHEGLRSQLPGERFLLLTRSSTIGTHRYCGLWTGDNHSRWEDLRQSLCQKQSLGLCGFNYVGSDIGGFNDNAHPELIIRWMQAGIVSPLYRNHTCKDTREQEKWAFCDTTLALSRAAVWLRYALLDYLYSSALSGRTNRVPYSAPLTFRFNDWGAADASDQLLVGDSLMIAPVVYPSARYRSVVLPESEWLYWPAQQWDRREMMVLPAGTHQLPVDLSVVPLFIQKNRFLILGEPKNSSVHMDSSQLVVVGLVDKEAKGQFYYDDGTSWSYEDDSYGVLEFSVVRGEHTFEATCKVIKEGADPCPVKSVLFELYDLDGTVHTLEEVLS